MSEEDKKRTDISKLPLSKRDIEFIEIGALFVRKDAILSVQYKLSKMTLEIVLITGNSISLSCDKRKEFEDTCCFVAKELRVKQRDSK